MRILSFLAAAVAPLLALAASSDAAAAAVPSGFVTTKNGQFSLNNKPFVCPICSRPALETDEGAQYYVGTNAYWLPQLNNQTDVDTVFASMQAAGVKVLRTWVRLSLRLSDPDGAHQ
jgi:mannan endo-1,4-beta-mannosidase